MESSFLKRLLSVCSLILVGFISYATSPAWKSSIPSSTSSGEYFDLRQQIRWNYGSYTNPQSGAVCNDYLNSASYNFNITITSVTGGASSGDISTTSDGKINFPQYPSDTYVKINYSVSVTITYSYEEAVFPGFNQPGCAYQTRNGNSTTLTRSGSIQRNYSTTNPVTGSSISYWDSFCVGDGINISVPSTSGATFRVRNSSTKAIVKSSTSTTLNIPASDVSDLLLSGNTYGFIVSRRVPYTYESTSGNSTYKRTSTRYSNPTYTRIDGEKSVCEGDLTQTYTVVGSNFDDSDWDCSSCTINSTTSNSANVTWNNNSSTKQIRVTLSRTTDSGDCTTIEYSDNVNFTFFTDYNVSGTSNVCFGDKGTINLSGSINGRTYELWDSGGRIANKDKTGTGSSLSWSDLDGDETYRVYLNSGTCGRYLQGTKTINEYSQKSKPNVSGTTEICSGSTLVLNGSTGNSTTSWEWFADYGSGYNKVTGQNTATLTLNNTSGLDRVRARYMDNNNCPSAYSNGVNIEVVDPVTPSITGLDEICVGDYNQSYSTSVATDGYFWSVTGGTISGGNTSRTVNINWNPGASNAKVTLISTTNSSGDIASCDTEEIDLSVVIRSNINFYTLTGTEDVCSGELGELTLSDSDNGLSYVLYIDGSRSEVGSHAKTGTGSALTWDNLTTGKTYSVYMETVECGNYKMGSDITINENTLSPKPTVTTLKEVCSGNDTYSFTFIGPSDANEFIVYDDSGSELGRATATSGSGTYQLPVTSSETDFVVSYIDVNDCESAQTNFSVEYVIPPTPTISGDFEICQGAENGNIYDAGVDADSYVWSVTGGTIVGSSNQRTVEINWTPGASDASVSVYTRLESNSGSITCNSSLETEDVTVRDNISFFNVTGASSVCEGEKGSIILEGSVIGEVYALYVDGTRESAKSGIGSDLEWNNLDPNKTYAVYLETASCGNYLMDDEITITEYSVSTKPSIVTLKEVCGPGTYNFTFEGQTGLEEFYLYNSSDALIGTYPASDNQATALLNVSSSNNSFSVTYLDGNGCISAKTDFTIEIVNADPSPGILGSDEICQGAENNNVYDANVIADSYLWSVNGGTIIGPSTQKTVTVNWTPGASDASVEVIATYESSTGTLDCDSEETKLDVTILSNIETFNFNQTDFICEQSIGSATLSGSQVGKIYVLFKNGVRSDASSDAKIGTGSQLTWDNLEAFETYTINLEDGDCGNYQMNGSVTIEPVFSSNANARTNNDPLELQTTPSGTVESGEPVIFELSFGADSYYWEFTGDLSSKENRPVMVFNLPDTTIDVTVTLSYETGCDVSYTFNDVIEVVDSEGMFNTTTDNGSFELEVSVNGTSYQLYPNPATTVSNFSFKSIANETVKVTVSDLKQSVVNSFTFDVTNSPTEKTVIPIPLDGLTNGLYVTKIEAKQFERPIIIVGIKN